jgi:CO/xanthine dehydrogenase FAD-binding subunit
MSMATKNIFSPDSLEAALDLIDKYGSDLLVIAGGTMAMHLINEGLISPPVALTLHRAKLNEVRAVNGHVEIGATTTLTRVAQMSDLPLLAEAARHIGGWAIRNMATLAGNLFVPPPAGDAAVALLALDAEVITAKKGSVRKIPLERFFTGLMETALAPGELVTRINVPRPHGKTAFLKFGRRQANTPAVVTVATQIRQDDQGVCQEVRIALGAAGDYPLRVRHAEAALQGRKLDAQSIADAAAIAMKEAQPFSDAIASDWYRRKMVGVYVRRVLEAIGG